jgi:hypothetical protein
MRSHWLTLIWLFTRDIWLCDFQRLTQMFFVVGGAEMNKCAILVTAAMALAASNAYGLPTMDGQLAGDTAFYGAALSTQTAKTHFGDANTGDPANGGGGSEIDQVFGKVANGRLYVFVSGNLEPNFNKLEVFIDPGNGTGVNSIVGSALPVGVDAFCCGGIGTTSGALQRMNGLKFDTGFNAGYYLSFTNGYETVNPNMADSAQFWATSAHYADLTQGTTGKVVAAGMQLAPNGMPNTLRAPGDYNHNGTVDAADYVLWRKTLGNSVAKGTGADANGSLAIDAADYNIWANNYSTNTTISGFPYTPATLANGVTQALLGPALPGLAQGQLIDRTYAQSGGGCTGDTGAGCVAKELEFALNVDPSEVGTNQSSHRNFNNSIDLQMGFDNSNTIGVRGSGGPSWDLDATDDPQNVTTGLEFSIPLSQIGNPTSNIKLTAFVNGGGHDYSSNQYSGAGAVSGGAAVGNYGALFPDLSVEADGNQYVTIPNPGAGRGAAVPEPNSMALLLMGLMFGSQMVRRQK